MSLPLEDRVALEALCYRYDVAADERDAAAYVALWTPDGCWDGPFGRYEGHAALRRLIAEIAASEALRGTRHWPNNIVIEGAGDHATVSLDNLLMQATPEGPRLASLSRSDASLVKRDGRWLFRERTIRIAEPVS